MGKAFQQNDKNILSRSLFYNLEQGPMEMLRIDSADALIQQ